MRKFLLGLALCFAVAATASANTVCQTFPQTPGAETVRPVTSTDKISVGNPNISVQVFVVSGSGAVGTYAVQYTNVDPDLYSKGWITQATTYSAAGLATRNDANYQYARILETTGPASGTVVKVCLYAIKEPN